MRLSSSRAVHVRNIHERTLPASRKEVGALIDSLASSRDALWPHQTWPAMKFDRPLSVGAVGGHGPIQYTVEAYEREHLVRFRFTAPRGFAGTHGYEVESLGKEITRLRHVLEMETSGLASMTWPIVFRPLHDALIEDSLDRAERSLGLEPHSARWSLWVRLLRWMISGGKARSRSTE
jgi:hypothetical protein